MSVLNSRRLHELIEDGVIEGAGHEAVNSSSIDLTLGDYILLEKKPDHNENLVLSLERRDALPTTRIQLHKEGGFYFLPGSFCLGFTEQRFHLPPHISAEYSCNSSMCRVGLNHLKACWCDATWHDSALTLELKNELQYYSQELVAGMRIGQIVFLEHEPVPRKDSYAYKGRYNGDHEVSGVKKGEAK